MAHIDPTTTIARHSELVAVKEMARRVPHVSQITTHAAGWITIGITRVAVNSPSVTPYRPLNQSHRPSLWSGRHANSESRARLAAIRRIVVFSDQNACVISVDPIAATVAIAEAAPKTPVPWSLLARRMSRPAAHSMRAWQIAPR